MRLTSFAVIFAIIFAVIFSMINFEMRELEENAYLEIYNKKIIEHATNDATFNLKKSAEIYGNSIITSSEIDEKLIFDSFFKSMALSMGMNSDYDIEILKRYFPLVCLVENDGIVLSSYVEIKNEDGVFLKRIIMPKYRFYFADESIIYYPCLNGEITALYYEDGILKEENGCPENLVNRPNRTVKLSYLEQDDIKEIMKEKIRLQISSLISEEIERHENEMSKLGLHYDFFLPKEYEENSFAINSPCLIVLMQGYPLNQRVKSNTMNICKMDITQSDFYFAFIENGVRYYMSNSNPEVEDKEIIEAFTDEMSAVKAGYFKYE